MTVQELLAKLQEKIEVTENKEDLGVLNATVAKEKLRDALTYIKEELTFDLMNFCSAIDWVETNEIETIYRLYSNETGDNLVIRVKLDRTNPQIDTVSDIYRTAEFHERETAEMYGINYINHPDLRQFLLPDGVKTPLRKDFTHPDHHPMEKA
jgi:NADH-quinone oxidoreductase subunit C